MASGAVADARFDLGRVAQRTFASIGRNFAVFLLLALLLSGIPALLTGSLLTFAGIDHAGQSTSGENTATLVAIGVSAIGFVYLVGAVASLVLQGAITYGTIADLNGRRAQFAECLSMGLRNWFWLFLLAIVVILAEAVGYIFFIVPGLMLAVAWMVAVPAQVVEHTGVFGALSRSAELTRGHRWAIFGLLVIYLIASGVLQGSIIGIVAALAVSLSPNLSQAATQLVAQPLLSVATSLIGAAGVASIYYELRSTREGIGPEALAAVFD
ncbi:MAG TPA: glycerophosphoryl diester phosphodiesterase membrane domain-containing protein [Caulobacteraceae bacterium]